MTEKVREMMRQNYASQLEGLGYGPDGMALPKKQKQETQWISVKDRFPELGKDVLVYAVGKIDGFIGEREIAICKRYTMRVFPSAPEHETWSSPWRYFHTDYEITHWMPLPEPPKEVSNES